MKDREICFVVCQNIINKRNKLGTEAGKDSERGWRGGAFGKGDRGYRGRGKREREIWGGRAKYEGGLGVTM